MRKPVIPKKVVRRGRTAKSGTESKEASDALRVSHLRREVKTALELSIAALARADLIDQLATAAGLLEVLAEFPDSSAPVLAMRPRATRLAEEALEAWRDWQAHPARQRSV